VPLQKSRLDPELEAQDDAGREEIKIRQIKKLTDSSYGNPALKT